MFYTYDTFPITFQNQFQETNIIAGTWGSTNLENILHLKYINAYQENNIYVNA